MIEGKRFLIWLGAAVVLALAWGLPASGPLNPYVVQILMYVGINMILTLSLNLVNGYMGEFSVGHAGFMGIGAYVASVLTVAVLPRAWAALAFPAVLVCGGAGRGGGRAGRGLPLLPHPGGLPGHRHPGLQHDRQERPRKYPQPGRPPGLSGHAPSHHPVLGGRLGDLDPVDLAQPDLFQLRAGDHGHPGR